MIELLAVLSVAAATGLRIALPLLILGLIQGDLLWSHVPLLSALHPQILFGFLISWTLSEVVLPKWLLGQRVLQGVQLLLSPIVGAIASLTVVLSHDIHMFPWVLGVVGALLALVLQLVQVGWFYRLRGIPLWGVWLQDLLCLMLVVSAFDAPHQGGILALVMLLLSLRSAMLWREQQHSPHYLGDDASHIGRKTATSVRPCGPPTE